MSLNKTTPQVSDLTKNNIFLNDLKDFLFLTKKNLIKNYSAFLFS